MVQLPSFLHATPSIDCPRWPPSAGFVLVHGQTATSPSSGRRERRLRQVWSLAGLVELHAPSGRRTAAPVGGPPPHAARAARLSPFIRNPGPALAAPFPCGFFEPPIRRPARLFSRYFARLDSLHAAGGGDAVPANDRSVRRRLRAVFMSVTHHCFSGTDSAPGLRFRMPDRCIGLPSATLAQNMGRCPPLGSSRIANVQRPIGRYKS